MIGDVDVTTGEEVVQKLNKKYGANKVAFMKCDVTNVKDIEGKVNQKNFFR